jgi:hypothetical protein
MDSTEIDKTSGPPNLSRTADAPAGYANYKKLVELSNVTLSTANTALRDKVKKGLLAFDLLFNYFDKVFSSSNVLKGEFSPAANGGPDTDNARKASFFVNAFYKKTYPVWQREDDTGFPEFIEDITLDHFEEIIDKPSDFLKEAKDQKQAEKLMSDLKAVTLSVLETSKCTDAERDANNISADALVAFVSRFIYEFTSTRPCNPKKSVPGRTASGLLCTASTAMSRTARCLTSLMPKATRTHPTT